MIQGAPRQLESYSEYVSFDVAGQLLGISVLNVQEILPEQTVTRIPLTSPFVAGLLNLRGQIVTTLDLRRRLGLPPRPAEMNSMNIIIKEQEEYFSLVVDSVGDVMSVPTGAFVPPPSNLSEVWQKCCQGVYRLESGLLVVVDTLSIISLQSEHHHEGKEDNA